jgi:hypothetical protein
VRYQKGSISISTGQDVPVLRQVLESQFITHDQLFEFMRLGCYEANRHTFNWRVRRLLKNGFLDLHPVGHSCVYSIAAAGASLLAVTEKYCPVLTRKADRHTSSCDHSLELNELHLSLIRQGVLDEWKPEIAIRSRNELTEEGYVKDYDAIVTVRLLERTACFALEYERTPKKPKEYARIRSLLEREERLRCILYVVPNNDLAAFIFDCFAGTKISLLIGFATEFGRSFADMLVTDASSGVRKPVLLAL